jgi:hypothetical protein
MPNGACHTISETGETMEPWGFKRHYEQLTDEELLAVAADNRHLVPEAAAALNSEIRKRGVKSPEQPRWMRQSGSTEQVESLQDYEIYRRLFQKHQFISRYWYGLATGPFLLGLLLGRRIFENSMVLISLTVAWALFVIGYSLTFSLRWTNYKCPQCSRRFGIESECASCSFPRSPEQ